MKIAELLLQTLEANGVTHIFGNPGTTELPLVKACERRNKLKYVVALSEVSAVPMADGYARATRSLGVVNLHVAPGLGNGMGTLYTAGIAGTPLLVLVGGQDRRFLHTHPVLWGPVEKMAGTVCKAVFTLNNAFDAAANIRRALRTAMTPPYAPVALICPPDLLETESAAKPIAVAPARLAALDKTQVAAYAKFLAACKRPAIIAAEDVHWDDASAELDALATALGAPVYAAPYTGVLPIASTSHAYAGYLPPSLKQVSERLARHDALLFIGGRGLRNTLYSEAQLPQRKAWIGHDGNALAPDGEYAITTVAHLKSSLSAITKVLRRPRRAMKPARAALALPARKNGVLHPTRAISTLLDTFHDAIWVDEAGLSTSDVRQWMNLKAGEYLINGSGGIGWAIGGSVGAAIAQLKRKNARQVVAVIGDGSAA
jgi:benzoylformate decarboxylase